MPTHDLNHAKTWITAYSLIISKILHSPHHLYTLSSRSILSVSTGYSSWLSLLNKDNMPTTKLKVFPASLTYSSSLCDPMKGTTVSALAGTHWDFGELQKGTLYQTGSDLHQIRQWYSGETLLSHLFCWMSLWSVYTIPQCVVGGTAISYWKSESQSHHLCKDSGMGFCSFYIRNICIIWKKLLPNTPVSPVIQYIF